MTQLSLPEMRNYLTRSVSSFNENKVRGLLAEIQLREYLTQLGFGERVSVGGWIFRNTRTRNFGNRTIAVFPELIQPDANYGPNRLLPPIPDGLHTIGPVFHEAGIDAYYCTATIGEQSTAESVTWNAVQLALPRTPRPQPFPHGIAGFTPRMRPYNWLRHTATLDNIPQTAIPEEFSKENLRVAFQTSYFTELSDIDGVFWGNRCTYPLEIKEKTASVAPDTGEFFGLDLGPFVKLAFYTANRGNLRSLFIVREIDAVDTRNLRQWWFITFERLARVASWVGSAGGTSMGGGRSAVVRIPKSQFQPLTRETLNALE